jgi:hypothetical protein
MKEITGLGTESLAIHWKAILDMIIKPTQITLCPIPLLLADEFSRGMLVSVRYRSGPGTWSQGYRSSFSRGILIPQVLKLRRSSPQSLLSQRLQRCCHTPVIKV